MTKTATAIAAALSMTWLLMGTSGSHAQSPRACPHDEGQRDLIAATLKSAVSCQTAYDLLNACRSNTSGDVALAEIVIERCEGTFLSGLAAAAKRQYEQDRDACRRRYAKREGTMYVSFSATCEAGVAARYAGSAQTRSRGK